jgi:peroxiredoxin
VIVPSLKRCLRAAALLVVLALPGIASSAGTLAKGSGESAPPLVLRDIDGREVRLESFRGRTVVVNFWATWCAPCVAEMPSLERLRERLRADGLEVLAVNLQENAARIRPFAERLGLSMPMLRDHDGSVRTAWNVSVFPTTFVVGPDQRIAHIAIGEIEWDAPAVVAKIRETMRAPGATPTSRQAGALHPPSHTTWSSSWTAAAS